MYIDREVLSNDEIAMFELRSLYKGYGYERYVFSKFEEYDLYVRNKDFLVSDNIITFTDTDGKLLALKPDITLSIVKNSKDIPDAVQKVYYNENVYRVSKGTKSFKELMQVGLECIGSIGSESILEVLTLAAKSLETISDDYVLDVSHVGILTALLDSMQLSHDARKELIKCVGEKNVHDISAICAAEGIDGEPLKKLVLAYGSPEKVRPALEEIRTAETGDAIDLLLTTVETLEQQGLAGRIRIDFSVINDVKYYNGIAFKGYIDGIASGVLSGGQYDNLMRRMGRKSGAIGFAVYLDVLEDLAYSGKQKKNAGKED